ncbi:MAG: hypothetical protein IPI49_00030 [Myxococcales bacterium]|nr:hypothetical protein [Myxococcales bacterium]
MTPTPGTSSRRSIIRPRFAVGSKPALPPNPNERRRPFPRRDQPNYDQELLLGLRNFGFDFSQPELPDAVRLFQCLARDTRYYRITRANFITGTFEDEGLWSALWRSYNKTWGRFLGAPWLGIVASDLEQIWGTRQTLRLLYDIGRKYLDASNSHTDLLYRLENPIPLLRIGSRLGRPFLPGDSYPGQEVTFGIPNDPSLLPLFGEAFSIIRSSVFVSSNSSARSILPPPTPLTGALSFVAITSPHTISREILSLYDTNSLSSAREKYIQDYAPSDPEHSRLLIEFYAGAQIRPPWRSIIPRHFISLVNGAISQNSAKCTLICGGMLLNTEKILHQPRTTPTPLFINELTEAKNPLLRHLNSINISIFDIQLESISPNTSLTVNIYGRFTEPSADANYNDNDNDNDTIVEIWSTRTLPSNTSSPIVFMAASCYHDFGIRNDNEGYLQPGLRYALSLERVWQFICNRLSRRFSATTYTLTLPDFRIESSREDSSRQKKHC